MIGRYHVHHIVAQNDPRASLARLILEDYLHISVNSIINLVPVKETVHRRLHNNWYYLTVNHMVYNAYVSAAGDPKMQFNNVTAVLSSLRVYIETLNALC